MTMNRSKIKKIVIAFCLLLLGLCGVFYYSASRTAVAASQSDVQEETVAFNTKTHKYHCLTCIWAQRCTRNCVNIPLSEAIAQGGRPCKVCGGTCR